jgi:hypothetical protein
MVLVQLAPAASGLGQVDADLANELAAEPVIVVEAVKLTADDVLFVRVMTWVAADVPTVVEAKVSEDGVIVNPELAPAPVPDNATVWPVVEAESWYVTVAVRLPADCGVKVMVLVQLAPAARVPQVDAVFANELAPAPVMVVEPVKVTADDVLFVRVMTCVAALDPTVVEAKVSEDGVIVNPVLALAPVPDKATVWPVVDAESWYVTVAVRLPADCGVKVMVLVQLAPAARVPQVDAVLANELAPAPVMVVEPVKVTADDVLFVRVITWVAADVPTVVEAKVSEDGVIVRPVLAFPPVPEMFTVCGEPVALSVKVRTAVNVPVDAGVKVRETAQLAPEARVVVHVVEVFPKAVDPVS